MDFKKNNLKTKVASNTIFALLDVFLTKVGTTFAFILIVRLLPEKDIAAIGIATGYLVFAAYLEVGPIRVLLRDYPKVSKSQQKRDELLTGLLLFWVIQAISIVIVAIIINSFVLGRLSISGLPFLFIGLIIDFIALSWQDWIKTIYYADFKQKIATKFSLLLTVLRLICYLIILLYPALNTYVWILIGTSFFNCFIWAILFESRFEYRPIFKTKILGTLIGSLRSYGIWDHGNRVVIDTLFTVDTAVLSWVSIGHLIDISNYTIALKFTSLFFIISHQLRRSMQLTLSNYKKEENQVNAISTFFKLNSLVSFSQLLFVILAGDWLIQLLFGSKIDPVVFHYVIIISVGVAIMNLAIPFIGIINNFCNLKKAFLQVFLPSLIFGGFVYIISAEFWGAIGIAYGNIISYSILSLGLLLFTINYYPFSSRIPLINSWERKLLKNGTRFEMFKR